MNDTPPEWAMEAAEAALDASQFTTLSQAITAIHSVARVIAAEREAATEQCAHWLNAMPKSWELACENEDSSDLSTDLVWRVYTVHGGLNDREWTRLGTGDTPYNAISAAFIAAAIRKGGT